MTQITAFNGKFYMTGGWNGYTTLNDIHSSVDGENWILETQDAQFTPRAGHQVVVFNNKLFM